MREKESDRSSSDTHTSRPASVKLWWCHPSSSGGVLYDPGVHFRVSTIPCLTDLVVNSDAMARVGDDHRGVGGGGG